MGTTLSAVAVLLLTISISSLGGCSSSSAQPPQTPRAPAPLGEATRESDQGYSLLYKLMSDEKDVGKIFILKRASDSVSAPVKEIGKSCDIAKKQLDKFRELDSRISYDVPDLPYIEQRSRDLEASTDRKILLSTSGKEFEAQLVLTQIQAMGYATQLCQALNEREQDPPHKAFLESVGKQCQDFHDRLMKLLVVQ